jgi:hypothetical protein
MDRGSCSHGMYKIASSATRKWYCMLDLKSKGKDEGEN